MLRNGSYDFENQIGVISMKVCLLNDSFPPVIDGVVNVVENYAQHLMLDHGAQVMVGTPGYPGTDYSIYPYPVIPYHSFDTAAITSGYRTGNPFSSNALEKMAAFAPDLIHTHCPASATIAARLLREGTSAPVIFTYHTKYDIDIMRVVKARPLAKEGIRLMISNIEACDEVWTVSRGAGENLRSLGFEGQYHVMPNGVDFERGRVIPEAVKEVTGGYDLPEGIPVYLYVGRMMTYKGLPLILDALRILKDQGMDFRMIFVGKGPDKELLEDRAKTLGLFGDGIRGGKCLFVGPVYDRDRLRAWNTRADLFLFPSTFDTNGLVVREAAACGLASVLIKNSCAAEGVRDGHNGFLIGESAAELAATLLKTGKNLSRLHEAGSHASDELYMSWQSSVKMAYERYQAVIDEKKRGVLPSKKKLPTDYLLGMTARSMHRRARLYQLGEEWFAGVKESADGMMENVENETEQLKEKIKDTFHSGIRHIHELMDEPETGCENCKEDDSCSGNDSSVSEKSRNGDE